MSPKMKIKKIKQSISDKISAALTVQPRPDVEDDLVFHTKPHILRREDLSSEDDEAVISEFRRQNVQLLSDLGDKYKGDVVSRRDLNLESDPDDSEDSVKDGENVVSSSTDVLQPQLDYDAETSDSDEESEDYSIAQSNKPTRSYSGNGSEAESGDSQNVDNSDVSDEEGYDISQTDEPPKETFEHMKKQNISEEVKKGQCVRNQLLIWEGLLEMRIHMQRCLNTANQMPAPQIHKQLRKEGGQEYVELSNKTKANVSSVLDKLLTLQNLLFKSFPETKYIPKSTGGTQERKVELKPDSDEEIPSDDEEMPSNDEEIPSDTEDNEKPSSTKESQKPLHDPPAKRRKLHDYEREISGTHKSFTPFRNATIQKWYDKTRLTGATHKNAPTNSIISQIDYILSDRNKLIRRTQLKRSEYDIVGHQKPQRSENKEEIDQTKDRKDDDEYIPEIFDDSDFYHQMLRELIECKSADITDPVQLSRQWIALQQMRSKIKRKVDTKATKGRRIKYVVHNKLVNFMAPNGTSSWTDESRNELYSSLFGKLFENNTVESRSGFKITSETTV